MRNRKGERIELKRLKAEKLCKEKERVQNRKGERIEANGLRRENYARRRKERGTRGGREYK